MIGIVSYLVKICLVSKAIPTIIRNLFLIQNIWPVLVVVRFENIEEKVWLHFHQHVPWISYGIFHFSLNLILYQIRLC